MKEFRVLVCCKLIRPAISLAALGLAWTILNSAEVTLELEMCTDGVNWVPQETGHLNIHTTQVQFRTGITPGAGEATCLCPPVIEDFPTGSGRLDLVLEKSSDLSGWDDAAPLTLDYGPKVFSRVQTRNVMARINEGSFEMGDSDGYGDAAELPVHSVYLSAYYMQTTEVTNREMAVVLNWAIGEGLASATAGTVQNLEGDPQELLDLDDSFGEISWNGSGLFVDAGKGDYPCVEVTWYGAMAYCHYLTLMEGVLNEAIDMADWSFDIHADGYRLPTEAEWERAARGGLTGQRFPWGDTIGHNEANYFASESFFYEASPTLGNHPDWDDDGLPHTNPVKAFSPNAHGLYGMAGNVLEWCADRYSSDFYDITPDTNPVGPDTGAYRVARGGGYSHSAHNCRVSARFNTHKYPTDSHHFLGFRVARTANPVVIITAGTFQMGDSIGDGFAPELPVHTVSLSAFRMQATEVTNAGMAMVLNWAIGQGLASATAASVTNLEGDSRELLDLDAIDPEIYLDGDGLKVIPGKQNYPCVEVTWYGAMAYCHYRTRMEGGMSQAVDLGDWSYDITLDGYRLPTEAEWEFAARGGLSGKRFPWGDTISHSQANYYSRSNFTYDVSLTNGAHPDWDNGDKPWTSPVGVFPPNAFGLHDVTGNVWEWCLDFYSASYYSNSPEINPTGPLTGLSRVHRGGGWSSGPDFSRVSVRNGHGPETSYTNIGFRPVRSMVP